MNGNIPNRRNWSRPLTFVAVLSLISVIIGYLADGGAEITDRRYFRNSGGPVLFDHGSHAAAANSCARCHHELFKADLAVACSQCHEEGMAAEEFSHSELKEFHGRDCSKCHSWDEEKVPTASCRECHLKAPQEENTPTNCQKCHEDDYTPGMISHDEYLDVEDHQCLGCHSPGSVSQTYHLSCTSCHLESAPDRFAKPDGGELCGACHLR